MNLAEIKEYLSDDLQRVNELMSTTLDSDIELLNQTNKFILAHSGKQLRPVLSLLIARALSGGTITNDTVSFASAGEILHNATLLHDDVADGSLERRGNPTVMSLLGGRAAVLLGDFWLVKAMDDILYEGNEASPAIRIFSKTLSDLAEGELLQLQKASSGDTSEEDYYRIIFNKTASLFEAVSVLAAISVNASEEQMEIVKTYADNLGIAFQIRDDIFDYEDGAEIGKPVGQDLAEQKITLPLLGALASVGEDEAREIRAKVCAMSEHPEYQAEVVEFVRKHHGVEYARKRLGEYCGKAAAVIRRLPANKDVDYMVQLAEFVGERQV